MERAFKLKIVLEDYAKFKDCNLVIASTELVKLGTLDNKYPNIIFILEYKAKIDALESNLNLQRRIASKIAKKLTSARWVERKKLK